MKHDLKEPCHACPYVGKMPGWIGAHETAQDFVDVVRADQQFPCHETVAANHARHQHRCNADGTVPLTGKEQHCAGYALFMNKMCKVSRDPDMAAMQKRLKETCTVEVIWPPAKMVEVHGK